MSELRNNLQNYSLFYSLFTLVGIELIGDHPPSCLPNFLEEL